MAKNALALIAVRNFRHLCHYKNYYYYHRRRRRWRDRLCKELNWIERLIAWARKTEIRKTYEEKKWKDLEKWDKTTPSIDGKKEDVRPIPMAFDWNLRRYWNVEFWTRKCELHVIIETFTFESQDAISRRKSSKSVTSPSHFVGCVVRKGKKEKNK